MIIEKTFLRKIEELEYEFTKDFFIFSNHNVRYQLIEDYKKGVILPAIEAARDATLEILQNETDRIDGEILVVLDEIERENKEYRGY